VRRRTVTPTIRKDLRTDTAVFECQRCHTSVNRENAFYRVIFGRERHMGQTALTQEHMQFCSDKCASYEQYSREG
jgi:endogenous inhibitor of DNA gyrase (YacG/DUF329 family)